KGFDRGGFSRLTAVATARFDEVAPRVFPAIKSLCCVLPLFLGRKSFADPGGISAGIVQINIDNGMLFLAGRGPPVLPVFQEILPMPRLVATETQEAGEVRVGYQALVYREPFEDRLSLEMANPETIGISQIVFGQRRGIIKTAFAHAHIHAQH